MRPVRKRKRKFVRHTDETAPPGVLGFFRAFYKPAVVILAVAVFFYLYNTYLVDKSLEDIEFALAETTRAESLGDVEGLDMLVQSILLKEVAPGELEFENLANLELAQDIISKGDSVRQLKDARFMLKEVAKNKRNKRFVLFNMLDKLNVALANIRGGLLYTLGSLSVRHKFFIEPDEEALEVARKLEREGNIEEAIKQYEQTLELVPQYQGRARLDLAIVYQKTGKFEKARYICAKIVQADSKSREGRIAARIMNELKEIKSLQSRKKVLTQEVLKVASEQQLQALYYELGAVNTSLLDFEAATEAYRKSYEVDETAEIASKAKFNLAWALKMQGESQESQKVFQEIIEEYPGTPVERDSRYWIAASLRDQGKFEKSIESFEEISQDFQGSKIAVLADFNTGYSYLYGLKDPEAAKAVFAKIGRQYSGMEITSHVKFGLLPEIGSVHREQGFKYVLQGSWDRAIDEFNKAIYYDSEDARSYSGMGAAKALKDDWRDAMEKAKTGVDLAPGDEFTHANLGYVHILQEEYEEALEEYKQAVFINPRYVEALYNLGWLFEKLKDYNNAILYYKKTIKYKPNFARGHNNLGTAYWKRGFYEKAADEFKKAIEIDRNYAQAHFNLAGYYALKEKYRLARREYEQVTHLTSEIPEAKEYIEKIDEILLYY